MLQNSVITLFTFCEKKDWNFLCCVGFTGEVFEFSKFILKACSEETLNFDNLLVAANLNR